jgi:glycosyltransferase involved in cell wall biosynthesis
MEKPKVSIIIPTYNSGATLAHCFKSIRNQSYCPIEIIVVDNLSNDTTTAIAAQWEARIIRKKSTPASARNIGIASSTGQYVFFIDSDQALSASVIAECVEKCEEEGARMVRVPEVFVGKGFWGSCSAEWKNSYRKVEEKYGASGNILTGQPRFFAKEQTIQAGMFSDSLVWGEDYDLYNRMRKMDAKEATCKSKLYHYEPVSIREILFKIFRYGHSMPTYTQHAGRRILLSMISHSLLTFKELLKEDIKYPSLIIGCAILLSLKTYFVTLGLVVGTLIS